MQSVVGLQRQIVTREHEASLDILTRVSFHYLKAKDCLQDVKQLDRIDEFTRLIGLAECNAVNQ